MAMLHRAFVIATCAMKTTAKFTHTLGFRVWTVPSIHTPHNSLHFAIHTSNIKYRNSHIEPQFEDVSTDVRERRGVGAGQLQILLHHSPDGRLLPSKDGRIIQVPFCGQELEN